MAISLAIISLSTVAYNKLSTNAYLKSSARHVAASLRYTRSYAVARGVESILRIDLKNRSYSFPGNSKSFTFKNNIDLNVFSASSLNKSEDVAEIRFAPDGSSSGGRVTLSSRNKKYVVYVDWLTGRVGVDG
jgi:general secretion pathway protein H